MNPSALHQLLNTLRTAAQSEREKGNSFEELVKVYLNNEPVYKDLFAGQVYLWDEWRQQCVQRYQSDPGIDKGIDLVAIEAGISEPRIFAIQAKFYDHETTLYKADLDSFFEQLGKKPFSNGMIFLTTDSTSRNLADALKGRDKQVAVTTLQDLENSQIDWVQYQPKLTPAFKAKKSLRPHQEIAVQHVGKGLTDADRGKLIMACGSGKTFTALKIAEALAGAGKRVLFLVPSLSLLSQTLTEWTQESVIPLHSFAVCSDAEIGKKRTVSEDTVHVLEHELRYPATTYPRRLAAELEQRHDAGHMSVVFATYHSIAVVSEAQQQCGLCAFDLVICDEAHRTTGATFEGEEESHFVRVHDASFIQASKRLYMTATPHIYGNLAKATAEKDSITLCSMDDEHLYGKELYVLTFSEAVARDLLVDYKVVVLAMDEAHVSRRLQGLLADPNNQLKVDDAAKIVGCWKALSKQDTREDLAGDSAHMQRAVAFCQVIERQQDAKTHKVSSKHIANMFSAVVEAYKASAADDLASTLNCEAQHIDGGMNASQKELKLNWLKSAVPDDTCRILSNVRCLSEGVDVPALDAVLFLTPRNSQVEVVQSVGRVMRKAAGKKRGYVILPVVIPAGVAPHEALDDNKTYRVVWQVLQALRSHDDRFDAMINKLELVGADTSKMEVIAITDKLGKRAEKAPKGASNERAGKGSFAIGSADATPNTAGQSELQFEIGEVERALYAKIVQKVGNRQHWEEWANDISKIANTHIDRIKGLLENPALTRERAAFHAFANEVRDDINNSVSDAEIIEMLAQHLITKPVFEALFADYQFAQHNPMSLAMQGVLDILQQHALGKEADTLEGFYASVKLRADGIDSAQGKQKIVVELYKKFFSNAFPKMTERLGIVYTPVEVVDFIIHSVNVALQNEFGLSLGAKDVHIIDPFTGTGTFITRLLQSGLIKPSELAYKYQHEIHANEIVLLAYYIAAINIEAAYHHLAGGHYQPFAGICLTDTFQLHEKDDLVNALLVDNSARRVKQKALDIRVIIGNPPYSIGQTSQNDNNQNVTYPHLDARIEATYAQRSSATTKKGLYDSYIRALRWASDRIGNSGVIGFVTNAGWLESNSADGLRQCLVAEFSSLYIFHLRGNQRTQGELSRKEGGKVFGGGSRAPIAISILVKNPAAHSRGQIYFHDIGDYLSREDKLDKIAQFASIAGISAAGAWQTIIPDASGDWLRQRDTSFAQFIVLGDKRGTAPKLFENYSLGVGTNRDAWAFNASHQKLATQMQATISFYNQELARFHAVHGELPAKARAEQVAGFIDTDPSKISWSSSLVQNFVRARQGSFSISEITHSLYRPFSKQHLYYDRMFNHRVGQMPQIFPHAGAENVVIMVNANHTGYGHIALIANALPDLHCNGDSQCFPLYLYDTPDAAPVTAQQSSLDLAIARAPTCQRRDAMTDAGLAHFQAAYTGETISKEDIFYYVYAVLHAPDYREKYADNLSKELPRIPCVPSAADFWRLSQAGRALADLHLNYETVTPYPATLEHAKPLADADYRVTKMRYGKAGKDKDRKDGKDKDRTTIHYNEHITVRGIPLAAYDYVVNGKSAIDWVVERQGVRTDKDSGIVNDANAWALDTMHNPRYPLELLLRVITVSLETMNIVRALPGVV